ncbi:MAG TPA: hypothetical protein VIL99_10205 [Ignavibacteria bacterium]
MKKFKVYLSLLVLLFVGGCNESVVAPPVIDNYTLYAVDYSDNSFLTDTLYKSCFETYYKSTNGIYPAFVVDNMILTGTPEFQIWVQTELTDTNSRIASGYIQLPPKPAGGYPDSLKQAATIPGISFMGYFRRLSPSEYYISEFAGMICFKNELPINNYAGIVYSTMNGMHYGNSSTAPDTIIIKLFKFENQNPITTPLAWQLKLKNIYRLPFGNIDPNGFSLNIVYKSGPPDTIIVRPGIPRTFLNIFQLTHTTDDNFNFVPYKTIIPETGDIIFPSLRPFYDDLKNAGVDSNYYYPQIYNYRKLEALTFPNANRYLIRGYAKSSP